MYWWSRILKLCLLIVFFISIFTIPLLNQELPRFIDWHNAGLDNEITYKDSVYLSAATAGQVTLTAPTASNNVVRIIGYITKANSNIMYFRPDSTYTVII